MGEVASAAQVAAASAEALDALLAAGATDADTRGQAALANAVAGGLAKRAGNAEAAGRHAARAEAILALLTPETRAIYAPIVARELGR
jgi:hypothetical protein